MTQIARLGAGSLARAVVLIDRGLRLHEVAVRNAARAVASDRVAARSRADAAAAVLANAELAGPRELVLVGA
jgi:hypothetical protein